jgi:nicotinamidase-related amidase
VAVTATGRPPDRHPGRTRPSSELDRELEGDLIPTGSPPAWFDADMTISAGATSAFHASPLDDLLRSQGRSDLILAGWGLEGPVHSTLRSANDRGYECLLVADASTALDPELVFASCEMVRFSGGIFGAFADTADVVAALRGDQADRSGQ